MGWNYIVTETTQENAKFDINIKYVSNGVDVITTAFVNVDGTEPVASGDPHFSQYVEDELTEKEKLICYDVSGESGQSVFILSINKEYEIYGKLLDDYYMHQIHILQNHKQLFNMTTNHLFYKNTLIDSLQNGLNKQMTFNDFQIFLKGNMIILKHINDDKFKIKIIRQENFLGQNFLDISFDLEMLKKENLGGLIGDVGNNHYKFFQTVQQNNNKFVLVNGMLKTAELKDRQSQNCLLFNTKDLIKDHSYNNYVY